MVQERVIGFAQRARHACASVLSRMLTRLSCPGADLNAYAWLLDDGDWVYWCLSEPSEG